MTFMPSLNPWNMMMDVKQPPADDSSDVPLKKPIAKKAAKVVVPPPAPTSDPTASIGTQGTPLDDGPLQTPQFGDDYSKFQRSLAGMDPKRLKGDVKGDTKENENHVNTTYDPLTPEQIEESQKAWLQSPMGQSAQQGVDKLQGMLDMQQKLADNQNQNNFDWSPLLAMADRGPNGPGHMLENYKAPPTPLQVQQGLIEAQEKLQARKDDMLKTMMNASRIKGGVSVDSNGNIINQGYQYGFAPPPNPKGGGAPTPGNFLTWSGQVSKNLAPIQKGLNDTDQITKLLNSNLPDAQIIARMSTIGLAGFHRFNENEIGAQLDPSIAAKFEQLFNSAVNGNLTPENKKQMIDTIKIMHDQILPTYNSAIEAQRANAAGAQLDSKKVEGSLAPYKYKGAAVGSSDSGGGKVTVTNGQKTLRIDASKLSDALKTPGWSQVK